jgi:hypothetical protein
MSALDCVARFNELRANLIPKNGKNFNIDTFKQMEMAHRERCRFLDYRPMDLTYDGLDQAYTLKGGNTKENQFLTPAEYSFFCDTADINDPKMLGFSVHTHQMAEMAH